MPRPACHSAPRRRACSPRKGSGPRRGRPGAPPTSPPRSGLLLYDRGLAATMDDGRWTMAVDRTLASPPSSIVHRPSSLIVIAPYSATRVPRLDSPAGTRTNQARRPGAGLPQQGIGARGHPILDFGFWILD